MNLLEIRKKLKPTIHTVKNSFQLFTELEFGSKIELDPKYSDGQNIQRPLCWTRFQEVEFLESIVLERTMPPIYLIVDRVNDIVNVLDGKNRINTLMKFFNNEIAVYSKCYRDLNEFESYIFRSFTFEAYTAYVGGPGREKISDADLAKLFYYINFAGTPQDLAKQEEVLKRITNA